MQVEVVLCGKTTLGGRDSVVPKQSDNSHANLADAIIDAVYITSQVPSMMGRFNSRLFGKVKWQNP